MRTAIAWIVGIIVFFAVGVGFTFLGDSLGIPITTDGYHDEATSLTTSYGYASGIIAFLGGIWSGQAIYARHLNAGFSKRGWFSFSAWLMALGILVVVSMLVQLAFRSFNGALAAYIRMFIELSAMLGVGWACHQWFKNRVNHLDNNSKI
jgi:hypothetical protein